MQPCFLIGRRQNMKKTIDDLNLEELLCLKASKLHIPITANFELTPLCNMNCDMCYIRHSQKEQKEIQRLRTVSEWINLAERLKKRGTLFILLTGGEPLMYPDFLQLYKELKKMGFILTINTNGTLFTDEIADILANDIPRRVNVTLYGASNETYQIITGNPYGYDETLHAIQLLKDRNIPTKLNCSMVRANMEDTKAILELSEKLNLPLEYNTYMYPCSRRKNKPFPSDVRVSPIDAARWSIFIKEFQKKEHFSELKEKILESYKNADNITSFTNAMKCRAGKSSCWINWKGEMTPCVFLDSPKINIFENSFEDAWQCMQDACEAFKFPSKCSYCKYRIHCNVCAASVRWDSVDVDDSPKYLCDYMSNVIDLLTAADTKTNS